MTAHSQRQRSSTSSGLRQMEMQHNSGDYERTSITWKLHTCLPPRSGTEGSSIEDAHDVALTFRQINIFLSTYQARLQHQTLCENLCTPPQSDSQLLVEAQRTESQLGHGSDGDKGTGAKEIRIEDPHGLRQHCPDEDIS